MRAQGPLKAAICFKTVAHHSQMLIFFVRRVDPVVAEIDRHRRIRKACDDVPMQIDGVQLDMRDGM